MPTLSLEGSVYHADALDRRELIRLGPSVTVSRVINRIRTQIPNGSTHDIDMTDLPNGKATVLLFNVSSGEATLKVTDDDDVISTFAANTMMIGLNMTIKDVTIEATADETVYDLILGGNE